MAQVFYFKFCTLRLHIKVDLDRCQSGKYFAIVSMFISPREASFSLALLEKLQFFSKKLQFLIVLSEDILSVRATGKIDFKLQEK